MTRTYDLARVSGMAIIIVAVTLAALQALGGVDVTISNSRLRLFFEVGGALFSADAVARVFASQIDISFTGSNADDQPSDDN